MSHTNICGNFVVYYESRKRRPIYECRYDERLKTKSEGSQIETRLIDERFPSVTSGCHCETMGTPSKLRLIRSAYSATGLVRMLPTLDLSCEENDTRRKWNGRLTPEGEKKWSE